MQINRKLQPAIQPLSHLRFPKPEVARLSNGIKVYQFNSGTQEVISVDMIFSAGTWFQNKPFTSLATNLMLREGTKNYTSQQMAEALDFFGAHFENSAERDDAFVSLYSLNKHLHKTLPLLEEIVKDPVFPHNEYDVLAGKQRQMLEVNRQKVNFLARTHFNPIIFGERHPYGIFLQPGDVDKINPTDLSKFHKQLYHSENCSIILAGKIGGDVLSLLEKYFGGTDWNGQKPSFNGQDATPSTLKYHFLNKERALQSAIRMGRIMVGRQHPDFAGLKVLNTILGGYFGSRLMSNLREDKGYTYGIGSAVVPLRHEGFFVITGEVGAEVTKQALGEIKIELDRLCNEKIKEKELLLVQNYMLGELLRAIDGPFAQASLFRELLDDDLNDHYLINLVNTIKNISAAELQDLAIQYINPDSLYTLVVGNEESCN